MATSASAADAGNGGSVVAVRLVNRLAGGATLFLRGSAAGLARAFPGAGDGGSDRRMYDCSGGALVDGVPCADDDSTTLFFGLAEGASVTLTVGDRDAISNCVAWATPDSAAAVAAGGPSKHSQVALAVTQSDVAFSVSFAEAVTCGISASYMRTGERAAAGSVTAVPPSPAGRYEVVVSHENGAGGAAVLADKHAAAAAEARLLAECPPLFSAASACNQHRCRVWHAERAATGTSYCNWIYDSGAAAHCWALDELRCKDVSCGYGGAGQPPALAADGSGECGVPDEVAPPAPGASSVWSAVDYSCGASHALPAAAGAAGAAAAWWTSGDTGCEPRTIAAAGGETATRTVRRGDAGGVLEIAFVNLPWLSGAETLSPNRYAAAAAAAAEPSSSSPCCLRPRGRRRAAPPPAAPAWGRAAAVAVLVILALAAIAAASRWWAASPVDAAAAQVLAWSPHAAAAHH